MRVQRIATIAVLGAGFGAVLVPPVVAGASPTLLIVGSSPGCTGTFSTISSAVAVAAPGDTIKVCKGVYNETVNVNTANLTFDGALAGTPGSAARKSASANESVVTSVNGDFILGSGANNTTINGFTLKGAGSPTVNHDGVEAFSGSSGLDLTDNVIQQNGNGVNFQNPNATDPATIAFNYIWNNNSEGNPGTNGSTGTGVFISNGPADSTSISNNTFGKDSQTAINFAGDSSNPSTGLVVANNISTDDATFLVAINSVNALVEKNTITVSGAVPGGNGTGILDFGANTALHIAKNTMSSIASVSSAIALATYAGSASVGTSITSNSISGWSNGVHVDSGYTTAFVSKNKVSGNAATGVLVDTGTSGNVMSLNRVSGDASSIDCSDQSTGSLTAGTANTWLGNVGSDSNSTPTGIC